MATFDITSLLDFRPATMQCLKCRALIVSSFYDAEIKTEKCPICGLVYVPTNDYLSVGLYIRENAPSFQVKLPENVIQHARHLGAISRMLGDGPFRIPPIAALFKALGAARSFVHFTTYGLADQVLGAMKLVGQRPGVGVRGIVSLGDSKRSSEYTDHRDESRGLDIKVYGSEKGWDDMPHQKLVVVDGLLAFTGSTNLTIRGLRGAAKGRDHMELITDVAKVIELHNKYFSPVWAEFSDEGDEIIMSDDGVPF